MTRLTLYTAFISLVSLLSTSGEIYSQSRKEKEAIIAVDAKLTSDSIRLEQLRERVVQLTSEKKVLVDALETCQRSDAKSDQIETTYKSDIQAKDKEIEQLNKEIRKLDKKKKAWKTAALIEALPAAVGIITIIILLL